MPVARQKLGNQKGKQVKKESGSGNAYKRPGRPRIGVLRSAATKTKTSYKPRRLSDVSSAHIHEGVTRAEKFLASCSRLLRRPAIPAVTLLLQTPFQILQQWIPPMAAHFQHDFGTFQGKSTSGASEITVLGSLSIGDGGTRPKCTEQFPLDFWLSESSFCRLCCLGKGQLIWTRTGLQPLHPTGAYWSP